MGCDVLRPVWDDAGGADGFVSLEVEPSVAHDTDATVEQARDFWGRVDRPNLMVKIPGTEEGVAAIEESIAAGINVNVTLLFSVESYTAIAEAYIRGMERRLDAGESMDVHSVASFFVSRVDSEVDKRLEALGREDLRGLAAVANARAAYMKFKELFLGERFARVRDAGAPVQRPLWASTGVKDPRYPDTKYVETLVAPHTVNTMPMPTLLACAEKLEVTGATADQDPTADLEALAEAGIDMADVTKKLLIDGIDKFLEPFDKLVAGVETAREAAVTGRPPTIDASIPDELEPAIVERVTLAREEHVAKRVWALDESLWGGPGVPEIGNRLGWLTIVDKMLEHVEVLHEFVESVKADGFTDVALLGMGGSSLGPEVIRRSFGHIPGGLRLHVLDSTDPGAVLALERSVELEHTLFVVSSKSGGTIETLSHMRHFLERSGGDGSRFAVVTDPGSPLVDTARELGFRKVFENDPNIGGRYSVLSYFGLVPAALAGVNLEALLSRAQVAEASTTSFDDTSSNSGLWLGLVMGELALRGRDKVTFIVSPADRVLRTLGGAADRRVHRQARKGHPARGRRAPRRAGELRQRSAVRLPARLGGPGRGAGREGEGAGRRRPPHGHDVGGGGGRPGPDLLLRRVRHGRGRLGARHQPVRPAERAGGQGQHGQAARGGRPAGRGRGRSGRAARPGASRRTTWPCWASWRRPRRSTPP